MDNHDHEDSHKSEQELSTALAAEMFERIISNSSRIGKSVQVFSTRAEILDDDEFLARFEEFAGKHESGKSWRELVLDVSVNSGDIEFCDISVKLADFFLMKVRDDMLSKKGAVEDMRELYDPDMDFDDFHRFGCLKVLNGLNLHELHILDTMLNGRLAPRHVAVLMGNELISTLIQAYMHAALVASIFSVIKENKSS